jgi:hypothetical protein
LDDASLIHKEQPPFVVRRVNPDLISSRGYLSDTLDEPCDKTGGIDIYIDHINGVQYFYSVILFYVSPDKSRYHPIFDSSFSKPSVTVIKHATPTQRTRLSSSDHKETQTPLDNKELGDSERDGGLQCDSGDDSRDSDVDNVELSHLSDGLGVGCSACEAPGFDGSDSIGKIDEEGVRVSPALGKWRERIGRYSSDRYII